MFCFSFGGGGGLVSKGAAESAFEWLCNVFLKIECDSWEKLGFVVTLLSYFPYYAGSDCSDFSYNLSPVTLFIFNVL